MPALEPARNGGGLQSSCGVNRRRAGYFTIVNAFCLITDAFRAESVAFPLRRYLPGVSAFPPTRPRKVKLFLPAFPVIVNDPATFT